MNLCVEKSGLSGQVRIPASKSHTIRAVAIGSLAYGTSRVQNPLRSADTLYAVDVYEKLGAKITLEDDWIIRGTGRKLSVPEDVLDVGNSGTTLYIAIGSAALIDGYSVFTGDQQIRNRPAGPLLDAVTHLGARALSTRGNGRPPLIIGGPMNGGRAYVDASKTSQYVTSLLINCPLASADADILVRDLVEKPYIEMTLGWLDEQGIRYEREGYDHFVIPGGQNYNAFEKSIPGDFSSATFFLCAAAITGSELTLLGLDMADSQGDKAVVDMLREMGAKVEQLPEGIRITGGDLRGGEFDLEDTPDALPAMAVTACFADGVTRLVNVKQARHKETDRIKLMRKELAKMGGKVEELPDGLVITGSPLRGAKVNGHKDHRVVMALAVAGLAADGVTEIDTAEAVSITFPNFTELMQEAGAKIEVC
ncbi:MAG TPA: 3-phosphoshikimate 1-carboxyvinyltransferase [Armatimonadota bacterium]|nr:3-phosphoshikimate 1-carboxyvinyltransferase [Armatimonadota bacterium]